MYSIDRLPAFIDIGYVGERNYRVIEFDLTSWMEALPTGVPSVVLIRPGETEDDAYVATTTFENNILTWTITDSDVAKDGTGIAQIYLEKEVDSAVTVRGKSALVAIRVNESLGEPSSEIPEPQTAWIEQMTELKTQTVAAKTAAETAQTNAEAAQNAAEIAQGGAETAQTAAETAQGKAEEAQEKAEDAQGAAEEAQGAAEAAQSAAETAVGHYPYVDSVSGEWMVWNVGSGEYVTTGVEAQGPQGQQGPSGADGSDYYTFFKWSATQPTQDSDMTDSPNEYIGVYSGTSSTAPTTYTSYTWYKYKGETGATGAGVPSGGSTGQVLLKASGTDYDTSWGVMDLSAKVDKDQGTENAGKALGIGSDGMVTPVPFSGEDFTGATSTTAGVHGYVPAPAAGDQDKFLMASGVWAYMLAASQTFTLDNVSNTSGSYTHTTSIESVSADMKAIMLELGNPAAFLADISVTCSNGGITLTCSSVSGTSTVKVSVLKQADGSGHVSSTEFDILANRIGTLSSLTTTDKTNLVSAVNEVKGDIPSVINNLTSDSTTSALSAAQGGTLNSKTDGIEIPANADLNNYTTPGTYYCTSSANAQTISNKPSSIAIAFTMQVYRKSNVTYNQILHGYGTNGGAVFARTSTSAGWQPWFSYSYDIDSLNSKITPITGAVAPRGLVAVDCNAVTESSIIRTATGTTNMPISNNSGTLITFVALTNVIVQIYTYYYGQTFIRTNWYGTWTSWEALALKSERAVIKTSSQIANNSSATIAYPSGFSVDNSCVISAWYVSGGTNVYTGSFTVEQNSSGVKITNNTGASRSFRAVLFIP